MLIRVAGTNLLKDEQSRLAYVGEGGYEVWTTAMGARIVGQVRRRLGPIDVHWVSGCACASISKGRKRASCEGRRSSRDIVS